MIRARNISMLVAAAALLAIHIRPADAKLRNPKHCPSATGSEPGSHAVIFHGATATFEHEHGVHHTYPDVQVRVCIAEPDYRLRYHLDSHATSLPPVSPNPFQATTDALKHAATPTEARPPEVAPAPSGGAVSSKAEPTPTKPKEVTPPAAAGKAELESAINGDEDRIRHRLQAAQQALEQFSAPRNNGTSASLPSALQEIERAAAEVTGPVPILEPSAEALSDTLGKARDALARIAAADRPQTDHLVHARDEIEAARELVDRLDALFVGASAGKLLDENVLGEHRGKLAETKQTLARLDARTTAAAKAGLEAATSLERAWLIAVDTLNHFALADVNELYVPTDKEKHYELVIKADRLVFAAPDVSATEASTGSGTTPGARSTGAASVRHGLTYEHVTGFERSESVDVRGLTWLRVGFGIAWTSLRAAPYTLGYNDAGAQVIMRGDDTGLTPMFVLSHYWSGVDLREIQPWHKGRRYWWVNTFVPSFAVGIPVSRNPLENVFVGLQSSPVPGLALIGGVHLGAVPVLKHGYVEGQQPPQVQGQAFDASQAQERRLRAGWFVGITITDSLFIPFIAKAAGLNN